MLEVEKVMTHFVCLILFIKSQTNFIISIGFDMSVTMDDRPINIQRFSRRHYLITPNVKRL